MNSDKYEEAGNLASLKRAWEELQTNPAWVSLVEALQAQTDTLQQAILFGPVTSAEELYLIERKKGQLEGRLSITATATAMFEGVCADLQTAQELKGE